MNAAKTSAYLIVFLMIHPGVYYCWVRKWSVDVLLVRTHSKLILDYVWLAECANGAFSPETKCTASLTFVRRLSRPGSGVDLMPSPERGQVVLQ
jgi:hypothetical protein